MTKMESLERLVRLRDAGALTEEEFAREKAKILAEDEPASSPTDQPRVSPRIPSAPPQIVDAPLLSAGVQTSEDAVGMARRAWASVTAMVASSIVAGIANSVAIFNGAAVDMPLSGGEAAVFLLLVFVVEVGLAAVFGWLTARKHSLFGAWALLVWAVWSILYLFFEDPMKDGLAVLIGLVGLGGMAIWYAWVALRGVLAIRRFSRTIDGQQAVAEAVRAVRKELRPTLREALAEGGEASRPTRNVIRVVGLCAIAAVLLMGLLFWVMREPRSLAHEAQQSAAAPSTQSLELDPLPSESRSATNWATDIDPAELLGIWDWDDGICTNAESVHINADGSYWDGFASGTWRLSGQTLTLNLQAYDRYDGTGRPPAEQVDLTIQRISATEFMVHGGASRRLIRCA